MIIIIEIFGSPFMRSAAIVFALLIGTAVAAVATVDGKRFFNGKNIASAPAITFLWTKRFPLGRFRGYDGCWASGPPQQGCRQLWPISTGVNNEVCTL